MFKFSAVFQIWKKYIQKLNDWDLSLINHSSVVWYMYMIDVSHFHYKLLLTLKLNFVFLSSPGHIWVFLWFLTIFCPFQDMLCCRYHVIGTPRLVILDEEGNVVSLNARKQIKEDQENFPSNWTENTCKVKKP